MPMLPDSVPLGPVVYLVAGHVGAGVLTVQMRARRLAWLTAHRRPGCAVRRSTAALSSRPADHRVAHAYGDARRGVGRTER